jgi:hypothetical protein
MKPPEPPTLPDRSLETLLAAALTPPEPPDDFVARVLARLPSEAAGPARRPRRWLPLALAASAALAAVSGVIVEQRHEAAVALNAKAELLLALRITGRELDRTTHQLQSGRTAPDTDNGEQP